jgi:hypothetical protein
LADLKVLVVWEPILPTDWGKPTSPVLARIPDLRAVQFWDKDHFISKELRPQLSGSEPNCCTRAGTLWDTVALYPRNVKWGGQPVFIDGPVVDVAPELAKKLR